MAFHGIPTTFNHRVYRSRLEARWAIMFEMLEWKAEYEPFDCNGWIPDFAIRGHSKLPLLVEVKPTFVLPPETVLKIDQADEAHEVLLVGIAPMAADEWEGPRLGWIREMGYEGAAGQPCGWWQEALLGRWENRIGLCAAYGSYHDRISGENEGSNGYGVSLSEITAMWAEAGNLSQWRRG